MTYTFVINRIRSVIASCETLEQVDVATNYATFMLVRYVDSISKGTGGDDLGTYFGVKAKKEELVKWTKSLLQSKKLVLRK